jgi:ribA/ribD-fused uncharacterized protein
MVRLGGFEFFGPDCRDKQRSPFSNFWQCDGWTFSCRIHVGELHQRFIAEYVCSEQAFMKAKADMFGDVEVGTQIMKETKPQKIKALGRKVRKFDGKRWEVAAGAIMLQIVRAKFHSSEQLKLELLRPDFLDLKFAEASADPIWGIGFQLWLSPPPQQKMPDPLSLNAAQWPGQNQLGQILTRVRDELLAERGWPAPELVAVRTSAPMPVVSEARTHARTHDWSPSEIASLQLSPSEIAASLQMRRSPSENGRALFQDAYIQCEGAGAGGGSGREKLSLPLPRSSGRNSSGGRDSGGGRDSAIHPARSARVGSTMGGRGEREERGERGEREETKETKEKKEKLQNRVDELQVLFMDCITNRLCY